MSTKVVKLHTFFTSSEHFAFALRKSIMYLVFFFAITLLAEIGSAEVTPSKSTLPGGISEILKQSLALVQFRDGPLKGSNFAIGDCVDVDPCTIGDFRIEVPAIIGVSGTIELTGSRLIGQSQSVVSGTNPTRDNPTATYRVTTQTITREGNQNAELEGEGLAITSNGGYKLSLDQLVATAEFKLKIGNADALSVDSVTLTLRVNSLLVTLENLMINTESTLVDNMDVTNLINGIWLRMTDGVEDELKTLLNETLDGCTFQHLEDNQLGECSTTPGGVDSGALGNRLNILSIIPVFSMCLTRYF